MKLRRRTPSPPRETIITLIDVVFFLLVFFMLIGRMDATAPFEIVPPEGVSGSDMPAGGLTVAISGEGALALDGQPVGRADLVEKVGQAVAARPATLVRLNTHRDTRLELVLPLAAEIEALGAREVVLVVTPPAP